MRSHAALLLALATPAAAIDGVIEINEARATAGGISSCDGAGYPVEICDSGSYRLTSNLQFASEASDGIVVSASDVSLDLNGMTIRGSAENGCVVSGGGWTGCQGTSEPWGNGIVSAGSSVRVEVRNGRVIGAHRLGVALGSFAVIRDVSVSKNNLGGISAHPGSMLRNVAAVENGGVGIQLFGDSEVRDAVASGNGDFGIVVPRGATADGVAANSNLLAGIQVDAGRVAGFSAAMNGGEGVIATDGAMVDSGSIRDNARYDLTACGLRGAGGGSYHAVVITSLAGGNSASACGAVNLGSNSCQGGACPP